MESTNHDLRSRSDDLLLSEQDLTAQAEKLLGRVPEWYWGNKEALERNRIEVAEAAARFTAVLREFVEMNEKEKK